MEHKDQWGDGSIRMPYYEKWLVNTSLDFKPGKFEFINTFSPKKPQPIPAVIYTVMLLARVDVLRKRLTLVIVWEKIPAWTAFFPFPRVRKYSPRLSPHPTYRRTNSTKQRHGVRRTFMSQQRSFTRNGVSF